MNNQLENFIATMVLHGVGDSMGYYGGKWEFCHSTNDIHKQFEEFGGVKGLKLDPKKWPVSDDTVLHLANAECLIENNNKPLEPELYKSLVKYYKEGMRDMAGRAPGNTTMQSVSKLSFISEDGYRIPFNPRGGGCGVSMRSSCIGLRFPKPEQLYDLVAFSVESGRMTHHSPIGFLGGLVAALFTSYALQKKQIENWGIEMLKVLPIAKEYIIKEKYCVKENLENWKCFENEWIEYLKERKIDQENNTVCFPEKYGIKERDSFYKKVSHGNWPGANGLDSVIIAYDALLGSRNNWEELCLRGILHGGDNDSTGSIAASWYGALYGFENVPLENYKKLEYYERLTICGEKLYNIFKN